jgi:hypothetical protein
LRYALVVKANAFWWHEKDCAIYWWVSGDRLFAVAYGDTGGTEFL